MPKGPGAKTAPVEAIRTSVEERKLAETWCIVKPGMTSWTIFMAYIYSILLCSRRILSELSHATIWKSWYNYLAGLRY